MTPWARDALAQHPEDRARIEARAATLGVELGAVWSSTHREWIATADGHGRRVSLRAKGPLAAVLDGVMDDYESSYTPAELVTIYSQSGGSVTRA